MLTFEIRCTAKGQITWLRPASAPPPRTTISAELVEAVRGGYVDVAEISGGLLRIRTDDGMLVYRLGEFRFEVDGYEAEWPD